MADPNTANISLLQPNRGTDVGTWDTPVNYNTGVLDTLLGGTANIPLNNTNVVLSAAQFQSKRITFSSTLTGSVTITFPTSFTATYEIRHACTGSSAFTITLITTAAGNNAICAPPGEIIDIANSGVNLQYKNMGRIGTYWDYAGSSVPNWVSGCTVPPYLNCNGTTFSSATYPALHTVLGGTTLPDSPGRVRATLNQGTGRLTTAGGGVDGNTLFAAGASETTTLKSSNLPSNIPTKQVAHTHSYLGPGTAILNSGGGFQLQNGAGTTGPATISLTINPSTAAAGTDAPTGVVQPTYIGGLTLIRAA